MTLCLVLPWPYVRRLYFRAARQDWSCAVLAVGLSLWTYADGVIMQFEVTRFMVTDRTWVSWSTPPTHAYYFNNAPALAIHFSSKAELLIVNAWSWGVKASTASDPLDVLPAACARKNFIVVMCKNRNWKKRNWVPEIENRIEPNLENPNRPSPSVSPCCGGCVEHMHYGRVSVSLGKQT